LKLQFIGAAKMVTGSCYLLEVNQHKILIDCGLYQGSRAIRERNYQDFPFDSKEIAYCLITHAHTDHTGLVPKLFKDGFKGQVIATKATVELCKIMLPDSGHIQEMEVERKNRKRFRAGLTPLNPIYTAQEAADCIEHFRGVEYDESIDIFPDFRIRFRDAGHILGSAMIEIWVTEDGKEEKFVFSGDIGNDDQPYIHDPSTIIEADYIVMESTYGNRFHGNTVDKMQKLKTIIEETFKRGGKLIIPAFAVERTQDLLYYINQLYEEKQIEPVDIYIDSPLAIKATEIFRRSFRYFDRETQELIKQGDDPLNIPKLKFTHSAEESKALNNVKGRAIIIAASGMADAGRIKHHLKHNLWKPECTVLFVGYQAEGTLGRRLVGGEKLVTIHGEEVVVRARIEEIDGFSAHADQHGLLHWVEGFSKPIKEIILVHGESQAQLELAGKIKELTGKEPLIPELGETFNWDVNELQRISPPIIQVAHQELEEAAEEVTTTPRRRPEKVTQAQINKAYLRLRTKLKELVDNGRRIHDPSTVLRNLQEITNWVDGKLEKGKRK
jgi:metallo-beta-lactamase family protein